MVPTEIWSKTPNAVQDALLNLAGYVNNVQDDLNIYDQQLVSLVTEVTARKQEAQELKKQLDGSNSNDALFEMLRVISLGIANRPRSPREIAFVSARPLSRQLKLAYGLKQQGWKVSLITERRAPGRIQLCEQQEEVFDKIYLYSDLLEAVMLTLVISPVAYHCFSSWDFSLSEKIMKIPPEEIIFDDYEILSGTMQPEFTQ